MKSFGHTRPHVIMIVILCGLAGYNVIQAQTWTAPTADPTGDAITAPLNESGVPQTKPGDLTVGGNLSTPNTLGANWLNLIGGMQITNTGSSYTYNDSNHVNWWTHANDGNFYVVNSHWDDSWGPWPHPLWINTGDPNNGWDGFTIFPNQVRAQSYCDVSGGNCVTPAQMAAGNITTSVITIGGVCFSPQKLLCVTGIGRLMGMIITLTLEVAVRTGIRIFGRRIF